MTKDKKAPSYPFASGGWGSLKSVATILKQEKVSLKHSAILLRQNKPDGFMCGVRSGRQLGRDRTGQRSHARRAPRGR
jgi:hypothetical protein